MFIGYIIGFFSFEISEYLILYAFVFVVILIILLDVFVVCLKAVDKYIDSKIKKVKVVK